VKNAGKLILLSILFCGLSSFVFALTNEEMLKLLEDTKHWEDVTKIEQISYTRRKLI